MDYPKLLYRDGDLSKDYIAVVDEDQEAEGNAQGFFFYLTYARPDDGVQIPDEVQEAAEEEIAPVRKRRARA